MTESERPMGLADPMFTEPFVDVDEWRDEPVRHRYVHGGFEGTDCRFSMYFPEAKRYQGRFFHAGPAGAGHRARRRRRAPSSGYIEFAVASGRVPGRVEPRARSGVRCRARTRPSPATAPSAAVATYSRALAAEMYGEHRPYGYVFGGSGGGYPHDGVHREHARRVGRRGAVHPPRRR